MNPGLEITLKAGAKTKTWLSKNGPKDFVDKEVKRLKADLLSKKQIEHSSRTMDLVLSFTNCEGSELKYFTNTVYNVDGGIHQTVLNSVIVKSIKPYAGKAEFKAADLLEGVVGLLNYKIASPQFSSQTKEKLVDGRVKEPCSEELSKVLAEFWSKNKSLAKELCARAAELRKKTEDFLKDKKLAKSVNNASRAMTAKLADIDGSSKVPTNERELIIVEGDSAGGGAKRARDRSYQAIWPIRGKILNVARAAKDAINSNAEIAGIIAALGIRLDTQHPLKTMKYGRVIFMADPDVDGRHINTLLATLFWKYMPQLYEEGRVFCLIAPEFLTRHKGKTWFADTKQELYKMTGSDNLTIQHIKGWGEVDEKDLETAGLGKGTRRLFRISPPKDADSRKNFNLLMSEDSSYRKQLLGITL